MQKRAFGLLITINIFLGDHPFFVSLVEKLSSGIPIGFTSEDMVIDEQGDKTLDFSLHTGNESRLTLSGVTKSGRVTMTAR